MAEGFEDRFSQLHNDGNGAEKTQAHDQRKPNADAARSCLLVKRKFVGQNRDEDEVVDPEDHLHHNEGCKRNPGGGIGG